MPRTLAPETREEMLLEVPTLQSDVRLLERRLANSPVEAIDEALHSIQRRLDKLKKQADYKG